MSSYRRRKAIRIYLLAAVIAALALLAIGYGIYFYVSLTVNAADVDMATQCQKAGPRSVSVVLIDATDAFTDAQKERLRNQLETVRRAVPRYSRLVIFAIDSSNPTGLSKALADACNPGNPEDVDKLTGNARMTAKDYDRLFDKPVMAALDQLMAAEGAEKSPIVEALEAATISVFGKLSGGDVTKRLYVVSDMLQNTPAFSLYKGVPAFQDFQKTPAYRMHIPSLTGVQIEVWEVNRERGPAISRRDLAKFWESYFTSFEGKILVWDNSII